MALVSELLDITNETELDTFVRRVVEQHAHRLPVPAVRELAAVLKETAKQTVPALTATLFAANGSIGKTFAIRRAAAVAATTERAARTYGIELEGMSTEDRDYEVARAFVRYARAVADQTLTSRTEKELPMFEVNTQAGSYGRAWDGESQYEGENYYEGEQPYEAESQYEDENYYEGEQPYEAEDEYEDEAMYEGEEQFFPALASLIPIAGQVLGGLLGGGRRRKRESSESGQYGESEEGGEAEEQFLHKIFGRLLGQEAEHNEAIISPAQEADLAARLLEVDSEEELGKILGGIVNTVGRAIQGVRGAANSPQGRALIEAVKPLARQALPNLAGAIGNAFVPGVGGQIGRTLGTAASSLFETDAYGMNAEQEEFELARRIVQLTTAAARDVATAPPGGPPELVGEMGMLRASRHFARPYFRRSLRLFSPFARRYFGRRYHGFRRGAGFRRGYGYRYRRPFPRYGYGFRGYGGYAAPQPEPGGEPAPPQQDAGPGFYWVRVPVGSPPPQPPAGEPAGPGGAPAGTGAGPDQPPAQSEYGPGGGYRGNGYSGGDAGGRWYRRGGEIVLRGA